MDRSIIELARERARIAEAAPQGERKETRPNAAESARQPESLDPMDRLVARGVTVRALVALTPYGADWLAQHQDDRFRICYCDETGTVVNEDVTAVGLVFRAQQLGWTASEDLEPDASAWLFRETAYHFRTGVHWFASATDGTDEMLPLGFPASVLKRAAKAQQQAFVAAQRAKEARAKETARSRARADREARAWLIEYSAQCQLDSAKSTGKQLTVAQARKTARGLVDAVAARAQERHQAKRDALAANNLPIAMEAKNEE